MVRVTPAPSRAREAWPGLSRGINLRGKRRKRSAERRARPQHFQVATSASVARFRAKQTVCADCVNLSAEHLQAVTSASVARTMDGCACRRSASLSWRMILSENRTPLFGIMRWRRKLSCRSLQDSDAIASRERSSIHLFPRAGERSDCIAIRVRRRCSESEPSNGVSGKRQRPLIPTFSPHAGRRRSKRCENEIPFFRPRDSGQGDHLAKQDVEGHLIPRVTFIERVSLKLTPLPPPASQGGGPPPRYRGRDAWRQRRFSAMIWPRLPCQ